MNDCFSYAAHTLCCGPCVFGGFWATREARVAGIGLPLAVTHSTDVACFLLGNKALNNLHHSKQCLVFISLQY